VGGNGEIVRDGVNGLLVPASDPQRVAGALNILLDDAGRCQQMGQAGREWSLVAATMVAMAKRYAAAYRGAGGAK
ncbi:MAG TPA: glycosyltransferase, partial [Pseudomonadota bacterium]|nr:glycosyltransferase [Pseudomonadota bacterium]